MPRKKTPEQYVKECKEKGYDLPIEDYKNDATKIKHKCSKGHIYEQTPNSHLKGRGCNICNLKKKITDNEYFTRCKEKGYDLPIEPYINARTKINHKCSRCNYVYKQLPNNHLSGNGCPRCAHNFKKTLKSYYHECISNHWDIPIENYKNCDTKIKHKCSKGHIYKQTPDKHHQGYGCPICNESHGEKYIRNYLDKNNINYVSQKTFKDLKDKQPLSYDFYLPDYNILIEYQGIQHYKSISFNGKDNTNLEKQQKHDKLKCDYAKNNGYKLLTLHYSLDSQEKVNKYLERRIK